MWSCREKEGVRNMTNVRDRDRKQDGSEEVLASLLVVCSEEDQRARTQPRVNVLCKRVHVPERVTVCV